MNRSLYVDNLVFTVFFPLCHFFFQITEPNLPLHLFGLQMKTTISRATSRNDMITVRDSLEIAAQIHRKDHADVFDYIQRHLGPLPVWDEMR